MDDKSRPHDTQSSKRPGCSQNQIEDLFTEDQIFMQHRAKFHDEDEKYVEKESEIVYCNEIPEFIRRAEGKPLINTEYYRWGVNHGKGFHKVVLQPTYNLDYIDSVKGCLLVNVTYRCS